MVWVNWGVRKDLLNISPSLRHAHNPKGDEPGSPSRCPAPAPRSSKLGSWGAQVVDEINPGEHDVQIIKHRFSAFWDTETDAVLRNMGIKTLFIGGVNMDQCVMTTLEDASFLGYDTILIEDATATTSPDYCVQAVLYNVKFLFGFVARSDGSARSACRLDQDRDCTNADDRRIRLDRRATFGARRSNCRSVPMPVANFVPFRRMRKS